MTTPSGTITMADVNAELGRSSTASVNMNETAVRALARKTSGTISMNDLRSKKFIDFPGFSVAAFGFPSLGEYAQAAFEVNSDGSVQGVDQSGFGYSVVYSSTWIPTTDAGIIDDYEIRVQQVSGSTIGGDSLNTWLNLSTNRSWAIGDFYPGSVAATANVQIRNAATGNVLETATVTLSAGF